MHMRVGAHLAFEVLETVDGADVDVVNRGSVCAAAGTVAATVAAGTVTGVVGTVTGVVTIAAVFFPQIRGLFQRRHAADARAVRQVVAVARAGALDEGDVPGFRAVRRSQQFAAGGAERVHHALELHAGDDIFDAPVTVRLDFGGVVRPPAGGENHRPAGDFQRLLAHVQIDGVVFAGGFCLLAFLRADNRRVDDISLRPRHVVRQVGGRDLVAAEVVRVADGGGDGARAVAAGGAVGVDIARRDGDFRGVIAGRAAQSREFGHGDDAQARVGGDAALVDFLAATGAAEFGEVFVELRDAPAQGRALLDENHILAAFGRFHGRGHAADAAADHQDGLGTGDGGGHGWAAVGLLCTVGVGAGPAMMAGVYYTARPAPIPVAAADAMNFPIAA